MSIGKHECRNAQNTHLKEAIAIGLDEVLTALEESFHDLSDAQVQGFPLAGQNNIAWIVMHCLDNLDEYAVGCATGQRVFPSEWRWDLWECSPEERPKPGDPFPSREEMLARLHQVRDAAMAAIDSLDEEALVATLTEGSSPRTRADCYMRTLYHENSHVRQIWLLRGALGLGGGAWPQQHWA